MASPSSPAPLSPQLAELRKQFEARSERAQQLVRGLSEQHLTQQPPDGGWSILHCIEHLALTNKLYKPIFEDAFTRAKHGSEPYRKDFKGRLLAWILEPPYRMKVKTRKDLDPLTFGDSKAVVKEFLATQQMIFGWLDRANSISLNDVFVASPFNEKMRYNLFSVFHILAAHERRHLWQAEQVKKQLT